MRLSRCANKILVEDFVCICTVVKNIGGFFCVHVWKLSLIKNQTKPYWHWKQKAWNLIVIYIAVFFEVILTTVKGTRNSITICHLNSSVKLFSLFGYLCSSVWLSSETLRLIPSMTRSAGFSIPAKSMNVEYRSIKEPTWWETFHKKRRRNI